MLDAFGETLFALWTQTLSMLFLEPSAIALASSLNDPSVALVTFNQRGYIRRG